MSSSAPSAKRLFWPLQIGGWALLVPASMGVTFTIYPDWQTSFVVALLRQFVGFVLTLGLWRIYRRWPVLDFRRPRIFLPAIGLCAVATAIDFAAVEGVRLILGLAEPPTVVLHGIGLLRAVIYVAWSALYFLIRHQIESRDTERQLAQAVATSREAELLQLRAQMNPHFLFNALNSIIGRAETQPETVAVITHAMANYLRYTLSHTAHRAPLGAELEAMRNYLQVETVAHGPDRLLWHIDASAGAKLALTPTALVQPLIENAIKYGLRTSAPPLDVRVQAQVTEDRLCVVVENSGGWVDRAAGIPDRPSTGIGLANLRRRLELLYEGAARLEVTTLPGRVRVEIQLPYET